MCLKVGRQGRGPQLRSDRNSSRSSRTEAGVRSELLTGVGGALGDGEVRAWAPRPALVVLLAFPTVGPCRVVLTLTGQFAVVVHAHRGVEVTFAPGQRRDKRSLSVRLAWWSLSLFPPVSPGCGSSATYRLQGKRWICSLVIRIFPASALGVGGGALTQPVLTAHWGEC